MAHGIEAARKVSLINAPRVSIVINGDAEAEGTREEWEKQFKSV